MNDMLKAAREIYNNLPDNDKAIIAFGMIPIDAAQKLERYAVANSISTEPKDIAVAFMQIANESGNVGMRV